VPLAISLKRIERDGSVRQPGFGALFRNYRAYQGRPVDFGLAQFGLPEPIGAPPIYESRGWRWHWWLLLAPNGFCSHDG
jgi:hypothetical protein